MKPPEGLLSFICPSGKLLGRIQSGPRRFHPMATIQPHGNVRAICRCLSRWLDGNRDELAPIRIPTAAEQRRRDGTRRRKFLGRLIRQLANRGHGQAGGYLHEPLPSH